MPETPIINFEEDKVLKWIKNGAQASDSVKKLLKTSGLEAKINVSQ